MGRPKRASSASTTLITFRLTADEAKLLDELVKELGFKDRSGLLRTWLAQLESVACGMGESPNLPVQTNMASGSADAKNDADEMAPAQSNREDEDAPEQASSSNAFQDLLVSVVIAIHREADERSGWSRIPKAVRLLLPHVTPAQFLVVMDGLRGAGMLELRPPNGRYERVRAGDAALCPRDSRGNILSRARLTGKGLELVRSILPSNPG